MGERDRLLVEAHLRHDPDAFAIIVDDHRDALTAQARRTLGPNGAVEDVVQETFERALKYIHRFGRSGDYRLGAWLNQILRNVAHDHRQRLYREWEAARASVAEVAPEPDVADTVGDPVMAAQLHQAVQDLPAHHRAAFVMREVEGLAYADVAKALNISEENVRARVSRSKGQLRRNTASLRTATGALVAVPAGLRAIQDRFSKLFHRSDGHAFGAGDRVATQIAASPIAQSAINLVSTVPRGTFIFGVAATVATLGATTLVVAGTGGSSHPVLAAVIAPAVQQAPSTPAPPAAPVAGQTSSSATSGASNVNATSYAWVNPGPGSSGTSGSPVAGLAAATCASTNGVTPPGSGFNVGAPLGLANAEAVADTPPVDLTTVGPSFSFSSPATISAYGSPIAATGATVASDVCLSSAGAWFTATVSGLGGDPVQLVGALQSVIGSGDDVGYVFRGTLAPSTSVSGPLAGAAQFVAEVTVIEPDNTAQLTVVFLGTEPVAATPDVPVGAGPVAGGTPTSPGAGGETSTPSDPVLSSLLPGPFPIPMGVPPVAGAASTTISGAGGLGGQGAFGGYGADGGGPIHMGSGLSALPSLP
jgi:RNA polymerase sigma-70 factor (ECF subfamily)